MGRGRLRDAGRAHAAPDRIPARSALQPVAELHTLRRAVHVRAKGDEAEVVHDSVRVLEGDRVVRQFDEVEIEQKRDGSERLIARLDRQLRAAGARPSDGRPKVFQALDLPAPQKPGNQARCARDRASPPVPAGAGRLSLVENDPRTRRGESEAVHAMRVATRRMRSALKEAGKLLDPTWLEETPP